MKNFGYLYLKDRYPDHYQDINIIFNDIEGSFAVSFLNKCDETEKPMLEEYFQRCFAEGHTEN